MFVVNRFRVPHPQEAAFRSGAEAALAVLRSKPGLVELTLGRNLDEPELWSLYSRWENVGSYRRALSGYESKLTVVPWLSLSIDEASAYDDPEAVGENRPRGEFG
ncbi:antibiotic biosynthesis monooxygenase family protein [Granulicoccus phenolivorans]|uniref:antibiotic biosynthesis monooxygenase family protein n=1 Tax=Granulicoccus phenolivorans TaxID=266854 RepID=UPI00040535C7|nr:antibiotic biosynthesis monooxygenase family protein [Granulicoccus phenolivorans]